MRSCSAELSSGISSDLYRTCPVFNLALLQYESAFLPTFRLTYRLCDAPALFFFFKVSKFLESKANIPRIGLFDFFQFIFGRAGNSFLGPEVAALLFSALFVQTFVSVPAELIMLLGYTFEFFLIIPFSIGKSATPSLSKFMINMELSSMSCTATPGYDLLVASSLIVLKPLMLLSFRTWDQVLPKCLVLEDSARLLFSVSLVMRIVEWCRFGCGIVWKPMSIY